MHFKNSCESIYSTAWLSLCFKIWFLCEPQPKVYVTNGHLCFTKAFCGLSIKFADMLMLKNQENHCKINYVLLDHVSLSKLYSIIFS